ASDAFLYAVRAAEEAFNSLKATVPQQLIPLMDGDSIFTTNNTDHVTRAGSIDEPAKLVLQYKKSRKQRRPRKFSPSPSVPSNFRDEVTDNLLISHSNSGNNLDICQNHIPPPQDNEDNAYEMVSSTVRDEQYDEKDTYIKKEIIDGQTFSNFINNVINTRDDDNVENSPQLISESSGKEKEKDVRSLLPTKRKIITRSYLRGLGASSESVQMLTDGVTRIRRKRRKDPQCSIQLPDADVQKRAKHPHVTSNIHSKEISNLDLETPFQPSINNEVREVRSSSSVEPISAQEPGTQNEASANSRDSKIFSQTNSQISTNKSIRKRGKPILAQRSDDSIVEKTVNQERSRKEIESQVVRKHKRPSTSVKRATTTREKGKEPIRHSFNDRSEHSNKNALGIPKLRAARKFAAPVRKPVPEKPERPLGSFGYFRQEMYEKRDVEFPGLSWRKALKFVAERWHTMDEESKKKYQEMQKEAGERFKIENREYIEYLEEHGLKVENKKQKNLNKSSKSGDEPM
ncbi:1340_t:CDS:2, partial [Acaulospora morrowiae]